MTRKLSQADIEEKLAELDNWASDGQKIVRHFKLKNFAEALEFVNKVGALAEKANHHPDIEFGWGYAVVTLTTHDVGGLTALDFTLAEKVEELAAGSV